MKLEDFVARMEEIAPPHLKLDFDNVGLLISPQNKEIRKVLVALDCSVSVAREAAETGADILLTHHPVFFGGVKHILDSDPATAGAYALIRSGIGLYSAHTNLDAAMGGVNDALAEALGVVDAKPLPPDMLGRIGRLETPMSLGDFASLIRDALGSAVRVCGHAEREVSRVALLGGAGGEYYAAAFAAGADVLVTGECKHHYALAARECGMALIDAGHYETERVVLSGLISRLQERGDDVQYKLSRSEEACLRRI